MPEPSIKEQMERLSALNEAANAIEALKIAMRALAWYADERHWHSDGWATRDAVDYDDVGEVGPDKTSVGGKKARNAIKRVNKTIAPGRVSKALREDA